MPEDTKFTLYLTVREVSLHPRVSRTPDQNFELVRVKCDSIEVDTKPYPFSGSFHFYLPPQAAPIPGEILEVSVKPWDPEAPTTAER